MTPATWEEALDQVAERLRTAGADALTLVGGRLSNEDLFNIAQLTGRVNGRKVLYSTMAGGDLTAQLGLPPGSNIADTGPETAILVVASDLEEEAPLWWLRVKQAAKRGVRLIVLNPRPTKLDRVAEFKLRYPYGAEVAAVLALTSILSADCPSLPEAFQHLALSSEMQAAAEAFATAQNGIVIFGSEGVGLTNSHALAHKPHQQTQQRSLRCLAARQRSGCLGHGLPPRPRPPIDFIGC